MRLLIYNLQLIILKLLTHRMLVKKTVIIQATLIFLYQRNNTKHDNRRSYITQNHFAFQRQYNTNNLELMIQFIQLQIDQMQLQINNLSAGGDPGGGGGGIDPNNPDIGLM